MQWMASPQKRRQRQPRSLRSASGEARSWGLLASTFVDRSERCPPSRVSPNKYTPMPERPGRQCDTRGRPVEALRNQLWASRGITSSTDRNRPRANCQRSVRSLPLLLSALENTNRLVDDVEARDRRK